MSGPQLEIQVVAAITAAACALPGVFLVLRRMAMMSDAISHAILLGIVLAFLVVENLASPLLVVGAALTGLATVAGVELLQQVPPVVARWLPVETERVVVASRLARDELASFDAQLDRWLDESDDAFALGEDNFNFRLHFEHALRDMGEAPHPRPTAE